ncbi:cupin domain-containing protein [Microbulbifer pacificus]|uniref:Cupin domain-containing protein n=1 Tax=Microbulbifer pacificus TaxID=407164 RepID=A0AAU0MWW6_9GAMM|nr:cupin domain-containing protein [Microbulbifer pacificus]WOX04681.1 cupin domain-containing protein [Microbulbifer pacificus]
MKINSDFSRRAVVAGDQYQWSASPQQGVERVMLDRVGEEKARATSIVRYAPDSHFPRHQHPGGEEILVLTGTFSDEDGHYPAGWYLRNPPGSSHQPFSDKGATIFVKLWQMDADDNCRVRIDTRNPTRWQQSDGRQTCALYSGHSEQVSLQRLAAGERLFHTPLQGAELLVLEGELVTDEQTLCQGSWVRLPAGEYPEFVACPAGVTIYLKSGQLGKTTSAL